MFMAMPWVETPCEMCSPTAPGAFRAAAFSKGGGCSEQGRVGTHQSFSGVPRPQPRPLSPRPASQSPVRGTSCEVSPPGGPPGGPPGLRSKPACLDPVGFDCLDHDVLEPLHKAPRAKAEVSQVADRVEDRLAGPVERRLSTARDPVQPDPLVPDRLQVDAKVALLAPLANREDGLVLCAHAWTEEERRSWRYATPVYGEAPH